LNESVAIFAGAKRCLMICANKLPERKIADEVIVNGELLHKR